MPRKKEQSATKPTKEKQPIEMTTEELLDAVIAPKVAERLREFPNDIFIHLSVGNQSKTRHEKQQS